MTPIDLRWNLIPRLFLLCQITYDVFMTHLAMSHQKRIFGPKSKIFVKTTPFDPKWLKIKFDTAIVFIVLNYISSDVFLTNPAISHRKQIFWSKSKIWPRMTPFVWPVNCAQISIFQVDFLEIFNNSRTRNENFDQFFDPKEPEYNIFGPIPEHSKITVFLCI